MFKKFLLVSILLLVLIGSVHALPVTTFDSFQVTGTTDQNITLTCTDNDTGCKAINYNINNEGWEQITNGFDDELEIDLVSYYKLDETTGDVVDELGTNDGTNNGATRGAIGKIGTAFDFDGSGDYVNTNMSGNGFTTGSFSVWAKSSNVTDYKVIIGKEFSDDGFDLSFNSSKAVLKYGNQFVSGDTTISTNTWYHIVGIATSTNILIYLNGNLDKNVSKTGTASSTQNYYIGNRPRAGGDFLGTIDEIGIWSRALTSDEVTELYNGGSGLSYSGSGDGYSFLYSGVGDHNIQYFSTDNSDNNEATNTSTFSTYGLANFTFYDENSSTLLNDITYTINPSINGDSGATLTDSNTLDLNLQGITSQEYTFTFIKIGYGTRYYVTNLNQFSEINVNFALLPSTLSTNIPLRVYQTDETTLFTNTFVELYRPDKNNIITGRRKTNSNGETTFSLHQLDQNYYANVNNGEYVYQPVALTILYPKNEDTLEQITELWKIEITNNLFISYTDLNASKIIYLLPNTALAFNIKISDMNDNYFSRTYAKQYPGNPLTDSLQPYLVPIDTGLLTTINTISSYTNQPVPFITIKIYKNIASIGRTLVEQIVTDSKGQALTLLNINEEYEFEIYDEDLEYVRTDTITSTSSTIYVKLDVLDFTDPTITDYYLTQAFNPARTKLITTDSELIQTTTLTNYGTNVLISRIDYWVTNTDQNSTGTDVNIFNLTVYPNTISYSNTIDINQENNTLEGIFYDTNGSLIVNVKVTLNDGNIFDYSFTYKPKIGFDWLYNAGIGMRNIFGCSGTNPDIPCPVMMLTALFLSILITISLAMSTGFTNMEGMGFIFLAILGMFTYFNWIPYLLYGIMVVSMIVIGIAVGGKRI